MPLISPKLDDLSFDRLEAIMRDRIPVVAPDWTDHNDSDPGIALIQLFAHMAEQVGYRLNRVPEKTYVEFLKFAGVQLKPARPAMTHMGFVLAQPADTEALVIPAYSRIDAKGGDGPPPSFETDVPLDVVPAQIAALITTRHGIENVNGPGELGPTIVGDDPDAYIAERFSIAWDGKTPKLKDMPLEPVSIFSTTETETHTSLYIGLAFNDLPSAGFKGARAALHLQIDADEEPDEDDQIMAGAAPLSVVNAFPGGEMVVTYEYFRPGDGAGRPDQWLPLTILDDDTDAWMRSGFIRFDVPTGMGPIPDGSWANVETEDGVSIEADVAHPLIDALKTPVSNTPSEVPISGWIRVRFTVAPKIAIRSLSFNTVQASHLTTEQRERLLRGTGQPGQTMQLGNGNVAADTLDLVSRDTTVSDALIPWRQVLDFDAAGPNDRVFVLDPEAGLIIFGDGRQGFPPQPTDLMIAMLYRHGGGLSGEVGTGRVSQPAGLPVAVSAAVNFVPARGGRDAETLEMAKSRAPRSFRMRGRAVTASDYRDAALETPGVRVARAEVVPLRRPYPQGHKIGDQLAPGIDVTTTAAGALSVIVVPDEPGPTPMPTTTALTAVAAHLETLRLVTTELHVTTPQYVRLFNFDIKVRAEPGYTRADLRTAIGDALRQRIHVLTGGADGSGFAFGGGLHHADLVSEVMRVPGVARVEELTCFFDGRTPDSAERPLMWRIERRVPMRLTNCMELSIDTDKIVLLPDEVPFVDPATLMINVTGAP